MPKKSKKSHSPSSLRKYEKAYNECLKKAMKRCEKMSRKSKRSSKKRKLTSYNKFVKQNIGKMKGDTQNEKMRACAIAWK